MEDDIVTLVCELMHGDPEGFLRVHRAIKRALEIEEKTPPPRSETPTKRPRAGRGLH